MEKSKEQLTEEQMDFAKNEAVTLRKLKDLLLTKHGIKSPYQVSLYHLKLGGLNQIMHHHGIEKTIQLALLGVKSVKEAGNIINGNPKMKTTGKIGLLESLELCNKYDPFQIKARSLKKPAPTQ